MVGIVGSLIVLGSLAVLIALAVRRPPPHSAPPADLPTPPSPGNDRLAQRVRRLEDDLDDLSAQVTQMRDDVQYLLRRIEDRS